MRSSILLALLLLSACGAKRSSFVMGKTTRADVVSLKGEPIKEEAIPVDDGKVMVYDNDEKYQLKGDVVVNSFKNPTKEQSLLLFWKHEFKDCVTNLKKLSQDINTHTPPEMELSCPAQGLSVIYTDGSSVVSRVVENEKK
jgi:hypothetical protein